MEEGKLPSGVTQSDDSSDALETTGTDLPVSAFASEQKTYPIENLEVHKQGEKAVVSSEDSTPNVFAFPRRRATIVSLAVTFVVVIVTSLIAAGFVWWNSDNVSEDPSSSQIPTQEVTFDDAGDNIVPELENADGQVLLINGDLVTKGNLKVVSGDFAATLGSQSLADDQTISLPDASGTICLDANNCEYVTEAALNDAIQAATGVTTSVNGFAGGLNIQGQTNRVIVTTNNGVITLSTPQDLTVVSSPTFSNLTLTGKLSIGGIVDTVLNCTTFANGGKLSTNASGQIICGDDKDSGGSGFVTDINSLTGSITIQGTTNQVNVATGAGVITVSAPQDIATTSNPQFANMALTGDLDVRGGDVIATVGSLRVASLGSNLAIGVTNHSTDIYGGVNGVRLHTTDAGVDITLNSADQIILNAGSSIELQDNTNVTGSFDVSGLAAFGSNASIPGLANSAVLVGHNLTGDCTFSCSGINIDVNAMVNSISTRGISSRVAQTGSGTFDAASFYASSAVLGAGGSIGTNYGLYVQNQTAGTSDYGVYIQGADTAALFIQSGGIQFEGATVDNNEVTITVADPTSDNTITLPNATGTVCLTSGNCAGVGGTGDILNNGQNGPIIIGTNDNTTLSLESGNVNRLSITGTGVTTFNPTGADADFSIQAVGDPNGLYFDATTGDLGLGRDPTASGGILGKLHVVGDSGLGSVLVLASGGTGANEGAGIEFKYGDGGGNSSFRISRILPSAVPGGGGHIFLQTADCQNCAYENQLAVFNTGHIGIGTGITSADGQLEIDADQTQAAWGTNGIQLQASSSTYTDSSTAASGTVTNAVFNSFATPTLAASNTNVTTTNAATVYIQNAPSAGTNQTITNAYSLWVDEGTARFDGDLNVRGNIIAQGQTNQTGTGTISTSGTTTVTGVGTSFTTQLAVGDVIVASGQTGRVTSITNDTTLTVSTVFTPDLSGSAFTYNKATVIRVADNTTAATIGSALNIFGAAGNGTGTGGSQAGGDVTIRAGLAAGIAGGGHLTLAGGDSLFAGGGITIDGGDGGGFNGGVINMFGGAGTGGNGGVVSISGGSSSTHNGGGLVLQGGSGSTGAGNVTISGGMSGGDITGMILLQTDLTDLTGLSIAADSSMAGITNISSGTAYSFDATDAGANGLLIDVQSSSSSQYVLSATSNNGATQGLYVRADGNVGIGTAAPTTTLEVEGDTTLSGNLNLSAVAGSSRVISGVFNSVFGGVSAHAAYFQNSSAGDTYLSVVGNGGGTTSGIYLHGEAFDNDEFGFIDYDGSNLSLGALNDLSGGGGGINLVTEASDDTVASRLSISQDGVTTFNPTGVDADFSVQGDNDANLFYVDAGNDRVGIGTATPGNKLSLNTLTVADAAAQLAVSTNGTTNKGMIVQGVAAQSADLFQAQDSTGAVLASISATGDLTVANATFKGSIAVNGHIVTANASGSTTVTDGAACGAGSASVSGNDTAGTVTITTGGGACASGVLGTVNFAGAFGVAPRVILTPANANSAAIQYFNGTTNTSSFTLDSGTNPTASTTYIYNYHVMQ